MAKGRERRDELLAGETRQLWHSGEREASAERAFRKLPAQIRSRIGSRLDGLAGNPRPSGCEKLCGVDDLFRVRVGDYRVVYQISDEVLVVLVVTIGLKLLTGTS
ncbi:MAG TPA: type II toxin-antitoxin system RelE/ParE family toxin [Thermoanaerobaculia bacterium]